MIISSAKDLPSETLKDLRNSKENRVEAQYYTQQINLDLKEVIRKTKNFVFEIERIHDGLNEGKIVELQKKWEL